MEKLTRNGTITDLVPPDRNCPSLDADRPTQTCGVEGSVARVEEYPNVKSPATYKRIYYVKCSKGHGWTVNMENGDLRRPPAPLSRS